MEHIIPQNYPLHAFNEDDDGGPVIGWHKRMDDHGDEVWVPIVVRIVSGGFSERANVARECTDIVRFAYKS